MSENVRPLTEEEFDTFFEDLKKLFKSSNEYKNKNINILLDLRDEIFKLISNKEIHRKIILNKEKNNKTYNDFINLYIYSILMITENKKRKNSNITINNYINAYNWSK